MLCRILAAPPGLERGEGVRIDDLSSTYERRGDAKVADEARKPADSEPSGPAFGPTVDVIEAALAKALEAAAAVGRFDVVAQLARELEARRLVRERSRVPFGTPLART